MPNPNPDKENQENLNAITGLSFGTLDLFLTTTFYTCYLKPSFTQTYNQTLKFFVLPLWAVNAIIACICAWHLAYIDKNLDNSTKHGRLTHAIVATVAAVFMVAAAVFGTVAQFAHTVLSPVFFAANMITNALFSLGASIYYWGKYAATPKPTPLLHPDNPDNEAQQEIAQNKKQLYKDRAIGHALSGILGTTIAVVALCVVVLQKTFLAPVGMALGIIGAALTIRETYHSIREHFRIVKKMKEAQSTEPTTTTAEPSPANTVGIFNALDARPALIRAPVAPIQSAKTSAVQDKPARNPTHDLDDYYRLRRTA